jgi:hypothetical protein
MDYIRMRVDGDGRPQLPGKMSDFASLDARNVPEIQLAKQERL